MASRSSRALALIVAATLVSAFVFKASADSGQRPEDTVVADFFDGLRAWKLKEEPTAAAIWLRAAPWGDVSSMEKIAELYERGEVLPQDTTLAYFWFSQAARRGAGSAQASADRLRAQLPAASIANVEATIESWHPKSLMTPATPEKKSDVDGLIAALNDGDLGLFRAALSSGVSASLSIKAAFQSSFWWSPPAKSNFLRPYWSSIPIPTSHCRME